MLLLFVAFVAGIILLYFEKKNRINTEKLIAGVIADIKGDSSLDEEAKKHKIKQWFYANGFEVHIDESGHKAYKKSFSLGWLLIGTSFGIIGALVYLLYYWKWLTPKEYLF